MEVAVGVTLQVGAKMRQDIDDRVDAGVRPIEPIVDALDRREQHGVTAVHEDLLMMPA
jgi:hypothetical protein